MTAERETLAEAMCDVDLPAALMHEEADMLAAAALAWFLAIVRAEQTSMDGYSDPAWSALERVADEAGRRR